LVQIFELILLFSAAGFLLWKLVLEDLFKPREVRRLEKMKTAMRKQLKAKKQVARLRRELGEVRAELESQEAEEVRRLEVEIEQLSLGGPASMVDPADDDPRRRIQTEERRSERE